MLNDIQTIELATGIGASECAAVLGINPWMTPYELWRIKTGRDKHDISKEPHVIMGQLLEPVIAERYMQRTGDKLAQVHKAYRHPKYPHILCHIDRRVVGKKKAVEIKKASPFSKDWGEENTEIFPAMYHAQIQHQYLATNGAFDDIEVAAYRGLSDIETFVTKPEPEVMNLIIEKVNHFWFEHVLKNVAPEPTTRGDLAILYPLNKGDYVMSTPQVYELLTKLKAIKIDIKEYTAEKVAHEKQVIEFIKDKDGIIDGDNVLATFKADKNGIRRLIIKGDKS